VPDSPDRASRSPFLPLLGVFGDPETGELLSERAAVAASLEVERALAAAQRSRGIVPLGYPILPLLAGSETPA
jgi:hypothetical protein